jgi:hypothetical protein
MNHRSRAVVVCVAAVTAALATSCSGSSAARSHSSAPTSTTTATGSSQSTATPSSVPPIPRIPQGRRLQGYLAVSPSQIIFFEWTDSGGKLDGAYYTLRASAHQVAPELRILDGHRDGNNVKLSVSGAPAWPGRIHGNTMTVLIPQAGRKSKWVDFTSATPAQYERAAQAFRHMVSTGAR